MNEGNLCKIFLHFDRIWWSEEPKPFALTLAWDEIRNGDWKTKITDFSG